MKRSNVRRLACGVAVAVAAACTAIAAAAPAYAGEPDPTEQLNTVLNNATGWLRKILAAIATFAVTLGAFRHVTANGDPGEVEKAKTAYKCAAVGYAMAALAPIIVAILKGILGVS